MNQAIRYVSIAIGGFVIGYATFFSIQVREALRDEGTTHEPYTFSLTPHIRPESIDPNRWLDIVEKAEQRAKDKLAIDFKQNAHVDLMIAPRNGGIDVIVFAGDTDRSLKNAITSAIAGALLVEEYKAKQEAEKAGGPAAEPGATDNPDDAQ